MTLTEKLNQMPETTILLPITKTEAEEMHHRIMSDLMVDAIKWETLNTSADWAKREVKSFSQEIKETMNGVN